MRLGKQNTSTEVAGDFGSFFLLKRIGASPNGPCVLVDFSPQPQPTNPNPNPQPQKVNKSHPIINLDRHFYTPAFILEEDEVPMPVIETKIKRNLSSYLTLHQERAIEAAEEKQEMFVAKPSKANSFCSICRTAIEDYLTHLSTPHHQQLLRSSEFCKDITEMCGKFAQKTKAIVKSKKRPTRPSRKCRAEREDSSQGNTAVSSAVGIDYYPLEKAVQAF